MTTAKRARVQERPDPGLLTHEEADRIRKLLHLKPSRRVFMDADGDDYEGNEGFECRIFINLPSDDNSEAAEKGYEREWEPTGWGSDFDDDPEASFAISSFPHCCGVRVIGGMDGITKADDVREGLATVVLDIACRYILGTERAGLVLCSDAVGNPSGALTEALMRRAGFREYADFHNPNSGNRVKVWGKVVS